MDMREHAENLARRRGRVSRIGGDEPVVHQHAAGTLTARASSIPAPR